MPRTAHLRPAALAALAGLALAAAPGCGSKEPATPDTAELSPMERLARQTVDQAPPPPKPAEAAPPKEEELSFGWKMRELGRSIQSAANRCDSFGADKLSAESARLGLPTVNLDNLEDGCRPLDKLYQKNKAEWWGRHPTLDAMALRLGRLGDTLDAFRHEMAKGKAGDALSQSVAELQRSIEWIKRTAGSLVEFNTDAKDRGEVAEETLSLGEWIAALKREITNDKSDVGTLADKFAQYATDPVAAGSIPWRNTLEHFSELRTRSLDAARKRLASTTTGDAAADARIRAAMEPYYQAQAAYVSAFVSAAKPYLGADVPDGRDAKATKKALEAAKAAFERANEAAPKALSGTP